jgi:hypothetical protein
VPETPERNPQSSPRRAIPFSRRGLSFNLAQRRLATRARKPLVYPNERRLRSLKLNDFLNINSDFSHTVARVRSKLQLRSGARLERKRTSILASGRPTSPAGQ